MKLPVHFQIIGLVLAIVVGLLVWTSYNDALPPPEKLHQLEQQLTAHLSDKIQKPFIVERRTNGPSRIDTCSTGAEGTFTYDVVIEQSVRKSIVVWWSLKNGQMCLVKLGDLR